MIEIKKAGSSSWLSRAGENDGSVRGGRLCGTSPTILTPASFRLNSQTASVVATTTKTGPVLTRTPVRPAPKPRLCNRGFRPFRTQNRNAVATTPMIAVIQFVSGRCWMIEMTSSNRLCPWASMPRMCFSWLAAMMIPDAVMKPAMTGCDRKLATNPSLNRPIASKITPERAASDRAATAYPIVPCSTMLDNAAAVISDTTATGPTASARLVPKMAYRMIGAMEA